MATAIASEAHRGPPLRGEVNPTQRMESLQRGYLQAVTAAAGCTIGSFDIDDGIDALIKHRSSEHNSGRDQVLQVQLKSTATVPAGADGAVSVQFKLDRFELFAEPDPTVHKIVVIMVQPVSPDEWIVASHDCLTLRHCSYWVNIAGDLSTAANPTVSAPRAQIFDDIALCSIMERVGQGGAP